jgi:hypothetical protein
VLLRLHVSGDHFLREGVDVSGEPKIEPRIEVELDIFSGRPNPRWMLLTEQTDKLRALLQAREPALPEDPAGLGYRGFLITNLGQDRMIPRKLRLYKVTVAISEGARPSYYKDTQGLEGSLLAYARQLGYGELIDRFRATASKS